MTAIRESVCASLGNRIQLVTNPREAWELLKPTITDEDEHAWISRVEHIQVSEFKSYLEFLDALQVLFNNMQIYVPDKKDWTEERVVKCGVRALRCRWDDWQLVIEFYSELEDKIKEAEGKELPGYTMQFFFKKVTKCAKQMKLRRDCQASGGRSPGVAMMAQAPAHARPPPHPPYQDKPCFDYQAGHCPRGSSCKFSHSASFGSRGVLVAAVEVVAVDEDLLEEDTGVVAKEQRSLNDSHSLEPATTAGGRGIKSMRVISHRRQ